LRRVAPALIAATALVSIASASDAVASGLYFSDRGVRPLGRGGAFVAGADDLGAIWYNPAGLTEAGTSLLVDFSWVHFTSDYTRQTQVTGQTVTTVTSPPVSGSSPFLPIPTLAASYAFGAQKQFTVAAGLFSPYAVIASYPLTIGGDPSPTRYSLVSLDGSALATVGAWIAAKPIETLSLGVGVEMLTGAFKSQVVFSACPADRLVCAAEDPKYDALSQLNVGPIFAPSANAGATFAPMPWLRVGASAQLPFHIDAPATVDVRLPNAVEFDQAYQQGHDAHVRFNLPAILRFGVEARPMDALRVEIAYVRELWNSHSSIDVTPQNIQLYKVAGFPSPFGVSPISIPRNFHDTSSVRLGGEYTVDASILGARKVAVRAGVSWEESAIPDPYLSALTIDLDKITPTVGASLFFGDHVRVDALYAHVFAFDKTVDPAAAAVPRVNPVQGNPTANEAVNGGSYSARADVIGIGAQYRF
jgi:long-chain fatty acid transport protein